MKFRHMSIFAVMFGVGAIASILAEWGHPIVTVNFKNKTQQSVTGVEVNYQNVEGDGVLNLDLRTPLKIGEEVTPLLL